MEYGVVELIPTKAKMRCNLYYYVPSVWSDGADSNDSKKSVAIFTIYVPWSMDWWNRFQRQQDVWFFTILNPWSMECVCIDQGVLLQVHPARLY